MVAYSRLADILDDKNVVRSEKVCIGQYVARKAVRYSRATHIQVPILLALAYLLISLIYPKAWVGFDDNPAYVKPTKNGFIAVNVNSTPLWSKTYDVDSLASARTYTIGDLDSDGKNEVAFVPKPGLSSNMEAVLYLYDHDGKELFARPCTIEAEYPGDSTADLNYYPSTVEFVQTDKGVRIVCCVCREYPARTHITVWNSDGESLGWYINSGFAHQRGVLESGAAGGQKLLVFTCTNNRVGSSGLFGLYVDSSYGVSPPFSDTIYALDGVTRGNQYSYVMLPRSDVSIALRARYNTIYRIVFEASGRFMVDLSPLTDTLNYATYFFDDRMRVGGVKLSDGFHTQRDQLVDRGLLSEINSGDYTEELLRAVTYWTDSGWVTEGQLRAAEKPH